MSHEMCAWVAAAAGLLSGLWLGMWSRDQYWTGKAHSVTRACGLNGKLYRVTEEP